MLKTIAGTTEPLAILLFSTEQYGGDRLVVFNHESHHALSPFQLPWPPMSLIVAMGERWSLFTAKPPVSDPKQHKFVYGRQHPVHQVVWYPQLLDENDNPFLATWLTDA